MNIANQGFPATRADLNNALQALASNNSGTSAPSTTFANQWWYDEANNKLYIRNEANNAWIQVAVLDQTNNEWQITTGVIQAKDGDGLALKTDDGTTRLFIKDSDGSIGIGTSSPSALLHVETADGTAGGAIKYTSTGAASGYISADAAGLCLATDTAGITFRTGITGNDPTDTGSERMRIQAGGEITSSTNPIFHCQRNSGVNNIAVNTTHTISFASQVIDRGNNIDGTVFTAPVTGGYLLSTTMRLDAIDTAATYYQVIISTSNRSYMIILDPNYTADPLYLVQTFTVIADMDAGDVAVVQIFQSGGSTQTDVNINSYFFGYLCG